MGCPISHSISPEIFRLFGKKLGHPVVYRKLEVKPEELKGSVQAIRRLSLLRGWNVTIPHKTATAKLMDHLFPKQQPRALSMWSGSQTGNSKALTPTSLESPKPFGSFKLKSGESQR